MYLREEDWFLPDERSDREPALAPPNTLTYPNSPVPK